MLDYCVHLLDIIVLVLPLALTPELNIRRRVTPGAARGMTSKLIPDLPEPPVRTAAVQ
jgi:hypothetical protein